MQVCTSCFAYLVDLNPFAKVIYNLHTQAVESDSKIQQQQQQQQETLAVKDKRNIIISENHESASEHAVIPDY